MKLCVRNIRRHIRQFSGILFILLTFAYLIHIMFSKSTYSPPPQNDAPKPDNAIPYVRTEEEIKEYDTDGFRKLYFENLTPNKIPNTLHYVWCGNETFRFNNFLSVMSAWKILRPDIIEYHIQYPIKDDSQNYHLWFNELQRSIPNFRVRRMPPWVKFSDTCSLSYGIDVLKDRGGIYVDSTFMFLKNFVDVSSNEFSIGTSSSDHNKIGFIRAERKDLTLGRIMYARRMKTEFPDPIRCEVFDNITNELPCIFVKNEIFPVDIFNLKNNFGNVSRQLILGYEHVVREETHIGGKIPKIVHYVWFGQHELTFMMYLSLLSTFNIVKPNKVFIHGDNKLYGDYWDEVKNHPLLVNVYRERPTKIFGHDIIYTQHFSDILRADILLKYGGIYIDFDVLWLKGVDNLTEAGHDVILNFDHMKRGDYPETINMGVVMSKPNARFLQIWQSKFIDYKTRNFFHNAIELPYKVYEMHPDLVHVERHLQVMCYQLMCHPTFKKNYMDWTKEQKFDWHSEAYAIHFTYPDPHAFSSLGALRNGTDKFAEMGNHILRKSGYKF